MIYLSVEVRSSRSTYINIELFRHEGLRYGTVYHLHVLGTGVWV